MPLRMTQGGGGFVEVSTTIRSESECERGNAAPFVEILVCHVHVATRLTLDPGFSRTAEDSSQLNQAITVIEEHGGWVEVVSFQQARRRFLINLPLLKPEVRLKERDQSLNERILVVDDDPVQRSVMRRILARQGYQVEMCSGGKEALRFLKGHPQDLLVLDMMMDDTTGTQVYRQVLEFQPTQKAIIVSGSCVRELIDKALQLGAGAFLSKPISPDDLTLAVRKVLDREQETT